MLYLYGCTDTLEGQEAFNELLELFLSNFILGICTTPVLRAVNGIILVVYPIHIVPDKMGMGKILFSLSHQVWVWVRKKFH
jgi:hypothetical protein